MEAVATEAAEPVDATVTVRYWAGARAAAGVDLDRIAADTVGEAVAAVAQLRPGLRGVLDVSTLLLDGSPAGSADPVPPGATIEVLPPFAGG